MNYNNENNRHPLFRIDRLGEIKKNNDGCDMQIIEYNNRDDVLVKFLDKGGYEVRVPYSAFKNGNIRNWGKHLYEENYNKIGLKMTIVGYRKSSDIDVQFDDGTIKKSTYTNFKKGNIKHPMINYHSQLIKDKIGMENINNQGSLMKIVEYTNQKNIVVEFQDDYKYRVNTQFKSFQNGMIHNPYYPSVIGVGILGTKYPIRDKDGNLLKAYQTWCDIIKRSFSDRIKEKQPMYYDVTCCDEWKLFENFYEWIVNEENYEIWKDIPRSAIDKDILIKGNKIYCPDACTLVPQEINELFVKNNKKRGKYPIGVSYHKASKKYIAACGDMNGGTINLGEYDNMIDAFNAYKMAKENLLKNVATDYYNKHIISKKCYDAMINYEVEMDD